MKAAKVNGVLLQSVGRTHKPRTDGITVVLDTGLGPHRIADLASVAGEHVDYAKIAWGSALITCDLEDKLRKYRAHGITPLLGGTLFEYAFVWGKVDELLDFVREVDCPIEISDGVVEVPRRDKLASIERFARHVPVFSELGGKPQSQALDWKTSLHEELSAGSIHVVIEGREIGPVGKEIRADLIDRILGWVEPARVVFEALERYQQVWLIRHVGPNVNLGNIRADDLLTVESFRRGLKEHTLLHTREKHGPPPARAP
jgi:phosphosulfolactate synthase